MIVVCGVEIRGDVALASMSASFERFCLAAGL
jgi:hypothetical protein